MTTEQFQQLLTEKHAEIEQALRRTLPVKVGRIAKDHFQDNFRKGGFQDNGLQPWARKKTTRQIRTAHVRQAEPIWLHILPPRRPPRHRRYRSSIRRHTQRGRRHRSHSTHETLLLGKIPRNKRRLVETHW